MNVLLDTNAIDLDFLKKIQAIKKKYSFEFNFFNSFILLEERVWPYYNHCLRKNDLNSYYELINLLFELTEERIFDYIKNIVSKEIKGNTRGKYYYLNLVGAKNIKSNFIKGNLNSVEYNKDKIKDWNLLLRSDNINFQGEISKELRPKKEENPGNFYKEVIEDLKRIGKEYLPNHSIEYILSKFKKFYSENPNITTNELKNRFFFILNYEYIKYTLNKTQFPEMIISCEENSYTDLYLKTLSYYRTYNIPPQGNEKTFDEGAPNDNRFIPLMKDLDILISNEKGYMKNCFNYIYGDKKKILNVQEFFEEYNL